MWIDLCDTLPVVRFWSSLQCCTISAHLSYLEVKVMDYKILCLSFLVKVFRALYLLNMWIVDTLLVICLV